MLDTKARERAETLFDRNQKREGKIAGGDALISKDIEAAYCAAGNPNQRATDGAVQNLR